MRANGRVTDAAEHQPVAEGAALGRWADVRSSDVMAVPAVATSMVNGLQLLVRELGLADEVRKAIVEADPLASYWVDCAPEADFCPVDRYLAVWGALGQLLSEERLRELGRERFERAMDAGRVAPILRSWARSCQHDPADFVRVAPHLWRGVTRGLGELRVLSEDGCSARVLFEVEHPLLARATAWHRVVEGWGEGLLSQVRGGRPLEPGQGVTVSVDARGRIEAVLRWA
jgi:hypothetical protein